jgi:hypothetical protein
MCDSKPNRKPADVPIAKPTDPPITPEQWTKPRPKD